MLRIHTNANAAIAKSYFSSADYYSEGQELLGTWHGSGAARLNLRGEVNQRDWDRLCDNLDPGSGKPLTVRRKLDRRVGYDFTFDVPKSVSLLYGLTGDERVLDAFRSSVDATMHEIEAEAQARVRINGMNEDRTTGNLVWGQYVHFTSRPVGGVPDPQLHAHCFVFNATFDPDESRWKAAQIGSIKRDAPYFQAAFDARLVRKLNDLGLPIERTQKGWEIQGLDKTTLDRFSRRTAQIEALAKAKGITNPVEKAALGAKIREKKDKSLSMDELRELWKSRLTPDETSTFDTQHRSIGSDPIAEREGAARESVQLAAEHCFERSSVIPERTLLTEALKRSVGAASLESVRDAYNRAGFIWSERDGRKLVTTREVLAEEQKMIDFARQGRGSQKPLAGSANHTHVFTRDWLNPGQRQAVQHVLTSPDRVMVIRGAAGVGKTSMMQEAVEAIEQCGVGARGENDGRKVFVFAPSTTASRDVLRAKGFADADTVTMLLRDERKHEGMRGQVLWIDEAGLLGTKTMARVFDLADKLDARVILSGDRKQHGSVERGAALRLLEEESGLIPAEIKEIKRQKGEYKDLVQSLSEGRTEDGFKALDTLSWIKEVPDEERYGVMARDYVDALRAGKTALVVSPTHAEGARVTTEIRSALRRAGRLKDEERAFQTLSTSDLTTAQRADRVNYSPDDVLVFHQNAKGFTKGQKVAVNNVDPSTLPLDQAERFQVFNSSSLALSPGDLIRVTKNGQTADRAHALNNGAVYAVKGFSKRGDLVLDNGWTVSKDFGHLAYGYVVTSHASQGRDVERVFIGQSAESFPASSREQFYVSVSRGTEKVTVYTNDKHELLDAVKRSDERLSATELVAETTASPDRSALQRPVISGPSRGMNRSGPANRPRPNPSIDPMNRRRRMLAAWRHARANEYEQHGPEYNPERHGPQRRVRGETWREERNDKWIERDR